jgi:hypothetical protein
MNTTRLKTLLIAVWGLFFILLLTILFFFWMQNRSLALAQAAAVPQTLPVPGQIEAQPATLSPTPTKRSVSTPTPLPSNTPATALAPALPLELPPNYNPYTGQIPANAALLERRPIAVKITNFPRRVRGYQFGLSRSDVAYEYYIEDGLTRFIAVFYGQDAEKAGPVRSGRYFDEHIARMYQSYLVFANADERVETHLLESDILQRLVVPTGLNCPPLCRDTTINDYNNFFINTAGLTEYTRKIGHENVRQELRSSYFELLPPAWPLEVNEITVRYSIYSYHSWRYDSLRRLYLRYADAVDANTRQDEVYEPHVDVLTGEQLSAANVVVLVVHHGFKSERERAAQVFDILLVNEGQAYIFREGRAIPGIWQRDALEQPIRLFDMGRNPLSLTPGQTYYIVINPEASLEQGEKSVRFTFSIPARYPTPTPTPPGFVPSPTPRRRP